MTECYYNENDPFDATNPRNPQIRVLMLEIRNVLMRHLQAAWREYCPVTDPAESRAERLVWLSAACGRSITSANDLSDAELEACIKQLAGGTPAGAPSEPQLWKIRQLEKWLGWSDNSARLAGLLRKLFKLDHPAALSRQQSWRAIEALMQIAARQAGKTKTQIREELRSWRPAVAEGEIPF
jgi:hypothetical protein